MPRPAPTSVTFAVIASAVAAFTLLQSLIIPVLSRIQTEMDTDQDTVTWVLTAYLLSASVCTPLIGRLGDAIGKQKMFVATVAMLAVGSAMAALAPSIGWLIAARVIQGAGGGTLPLAFGIIRDEFPEARRQSAIGVIAALGSIGFGAGIVLGGPIVEHLGYHWLFWLPMIVSGLAALAAAAFIPESPVRTPGGLPVGPAVLLSTWLVALLLAISQGNAWGWASPRVLGLVVLAAVVAGIWVGVESRVEVPLIDMVMMRRRGVWTANLVSGAVGFGMFAAFGFLPQLLQTPEVSGYGHGASISESGRILLPSALASFAVGALASRLVSRWGAARVIAAGCVCNGAAFIAMGLFHDETWHLLVASIVQGIGGGLVFSSMANVVVMSVPAEQTGVASGMNFNIRTIGGAIGTAVMTGIVTAQHGTSGFPLERGYTTGFCVLGASLLAAALAALLIPESRRGAVTTSRVMHDATA